MFVHQLHIHVCVFRTTRNEHRHPVNTVLAFERSTRHGAFLSIFVTIVILQHAEISQLIKQFVKGLVIWSIMLFGVPLVKLSITMMLSHFEKVAGKHVQEQIQRSLAGHSIHFIFENACKTPVLGSIGGHFNLSRNAVRNMTDEFDQFWIRILVPSVFGNKFVGHFRHIE